MFLKLVRVKLQRLLWVLRNILFQKDQWQHFRTFIPNQIFIQEEKILLCGKGENDDNMFPFKHHPNLAIITAHKTVATQSVQVHFLTYLVSNQKVTGNISPRHMSIMHIEGMHMSIMHTPPTHHRLHTKEKNPKSATSEDLETCSMESGHAQ